MGYNPSFCKTSTSPGRDNTKASFQLDSRHFRQGQKVKVKAARCGAEDRIVQTCLSTPDQMSVRAKAHLYQPFGRVLFAPGCQKGVTAPMMLVICSGAVMSRFAKRLQRSPASLASEAFHLRL